MLYWSTDKIIAGKYYIKKPIPVRFEMVNNSTIGPRVWMFNMWFSPLEDDVLWIQITEGKLSAQYEVPAAVGTISRDIQEMHIEFVRQLMPYLEEIKKED